MRCILIGLIILGAQSAMASPLQQSLSLSTGVEHESNPAMTAANARAVSRYKLSPGYEAKWVEGADEWNATARVDVERSSDQALSIDRQDPSLGVGWIRENPRGSTTALQATYDRQSTSATETNTPGGAGSNDTRTRYGVEGDWRHEVTERVEAEVNLAHEDNSYQGATGATSGFTNYKTTTGMASLEYLLNERNRPYVKAGASQYSPASGASSNLYTAVAGIKSDLSESLKFDANLGIAQTAGAADATGLNGLLSLGHEGERTKASVSYARASSASGSSGYTEADEVKASLGYELDPLTEVGADAAWTKTHSQSPLTTSSLGLWADRELLEDLSLRLGYEYKQQKTATDKAKGSVWSLSLSYDIPQL
ncbi:MAG: porin family protein [Gammaproteobacteria bacterium]|nr:porin family protein [Gammaproteobacteria bacterium]MBU1654317.1 porin family protein [Gammaproteobacteria bacterium]MBU1961208.1 porin family protein [Gammaproteobacteria bacterium]